MKISAKYHACGIGMKLRLFAGALTVLLTGLPVAAQYYNTGQDPASLKWLQIDTEKFRLIYPKSYAHEGILFAEALDKSFSRLEVLFSGSKFRIPVIIHSYSAETNGYVSWAPGRMEIFPAPGQNIIPWNTKEQISIHEAAHVYEITSMNKGFSKAMSMVFGQQFTGALSAMLPLWYMEGNAVFAETALTASGRGRDPAFLNELKAASVDGKQFYSYDMAVNGSYARYVPNHYHTGYQMTAYALAKNGMQVWNSALDFTGKYPFTINPVNISLAKSAGTSKKKLYHETFDTLAAVWSKEISMKSITAHTVINPGKQGEYISYSSPVEVASNRVAAVKESLGKPYGFVLIDTETGSEKTLHTPGQMRNLAISHGGGKITWVEYNRHPRWENLTYSDIKILDMQTGKTRSLSRKSRYFASAMSPDGKLIAAAENTTANRNSLVIIDVELGTVLQTIPAPDNAVVQRPQFDEKGIRITCLALAGNLEGIITYSLENHAWETTLEYQPYDIQSACVHGDTLLYIMAMPGDGAANIFLRTPGNATLRLTDSKYGVKDLAVYGNTVTFSSYTAGGYEICRTETTRHLPADAIQTPASSLLIDRFPEPPPDTAATKQYTPQPYKKHRNLVNPHSWMPFYVNIDELSLTQPSIRPGAMIMSQNSLSTLTATAGYEYSRNSENIFHTKIEYAGWLPVIETQIDAGQKQETYTPSGITPSMQPVKTGLRMLTTVRIPLVYHRGRYSQLIQPSASIEHRNSAIYSEETMSYRNGRTSIAGRLYLANTHRSSLRDIYPRIAQVIDLRYDIMPRYFSSISLRTALYFPGLLPNNSLRLRYETEKRPTASRLAVNNRISYPRGYTGIISRHLTFLSADYSFPVVYPDINIAGLVYVKRLRGTLFGDYAHGRHNSHYRIRPTGTAEEYAYTPAATFSSFGFEALADFHALRLPFTLSGGIQAAWKNTASPPALTVLFSINIFGTAISSSY
ncbi:MAG: hypothetical protein LBV26_06945 [Bacteroidales bacterium]|jgi:hypothetical protein|nr:hypothetical protein [Bacteroidales bacterium]